jgi:RNA polymerase sigma factor (TIGR02999 family)
MSDVTLILQAVQQGDAHAAEELLPLVYGELRKRAAYKLAREAPGQTLQPTVLVHEAWLRLVGTDEQDWHGRGHFFAAAAEVSSATTNTSRACTRCTRIREPHVVRLRHAVSAALSSKGGVSLMNTAA